MIWFATRAYLLTYLLPALPLTCRAATKVIHFCLPLAIFSTVSHMLFMVFISPSTVRLCVFFGLSPLHFPSEVQCSAVLVMTVLYLGYNCIVFENSTASIRNFIVANWVYWQCIYGASKRISATIKSTIVAVKFQIQYSYLHYNVIICRIDIRTSYAYFRIIDKVI